MDAMIRSSRSAELVTAASDDDILHDRRCAGWRVAELIGHCEGILVWLASKSAQPHDGPGIDRIRSFRRRPEDVRGAGNRHLGAGA
jgi:hypothetical protein